jgi:hypothetical protein
MCKDHFLRLRRNGDVGDDYANITMNIGGFNEISAGDSAKTSEV